MHVVADGVLQQDSRVENQIGIGRAAGIGQSLLQDRSRVSCGHQSEELSSPHAHEGLLPGLHFSSETLRGPGITLFYTMYWLMTGLHALHMTAGIAVMAWLAVRLGRGTITPADPIPLELGAMYWHLVDIIWLFLWPLLYLMK